MNKLNKKRAALVIRFYDLLNPKEQLEIPAEDGQHLLISLGQAVLVNHDGRVMTIAYYQRGAETPQKKVSYIVVDRRGRNQDWEKPLQIYPVSYQDPETAGEMKALTLQSRSVADISERMQKVIAELGDTWLQELRLRGYLD